MYIDVDDYQSEIAEVRFGKRVGTSIYFHEECLPYLPSGIAGLIERAQSSARADGRAFNVYKLDTRAPLVSLLAYPRFFDEGFPTLESSASWDPSTHSLSLRTYDDQANRPVLHRKELLLPLGHDRVDEFASLTEVAEQIGLFDDPARIGRYAFWASLLQDKEIRVVGHALRSSDGSPIEFEEPVQSVLRYRTALKRNRLSVPVQLLFSHEVLDEEKSFFDFGCGRGDDLAQLQDLGIKATGWDPHYRPDEPKVQADVVNLGYVVNVIEDKRERDSVVTEAYKLAREALVVSALVGSPSYSETAKQFKDGYITKSGTFQKYFQQHELADLVQKNTGAEPIALGRGTIMAFKSDEHEQEFLARRLSRRKQARVRVRITDLGQLSEDARSQADRYWERCIELARPATKEEVDGCGDLFKYVPSARKVHELVGKDRNGERFDEARSAREAELLVQFALSHFGKRMYFKYFPDTLKRDVEFHFGGYKSLLDQSKALLYSIADIEALLGACVDASDEGVGFLLDDHSLQLHMGLIEKLAPILRVYVGCAGVLYGDWAQVDLVKIHIQSGKVSFMGYDDFDGRPIPELLERIKVNMWSRDVEFFDYVGQFTPTPLLMKSLFVDETFEFFEEQSRFDRALMKTQLFDFTRDQLTKNQLYGELSQAGYRFEGYELVKTT